MYCRLFNQSIDPISLQTSYQNHIYIHFGEMQEIRRIQTFFFISNFSLRVLLRVKFKIAHRKHPNI